MKLRSNICYLVVSLSTEGWTWHIRQYGKGEPLEASSQIFRSEAAARADGLKALNVSSRYSSEPKANDDDGRPEESFE